MGLLSVHMARGGEFGLLAEAWRKGAAGSQSGSMNLCDAPPPLPLPPLQTGTKVL